MSGGGYERSDARLRPLAAFLAGLAGLIALSFGVTAWLTGSFARQRQADSRTDPMADFRTAPSGPRLQADPGRELREHEHDVRARLETYGWIDAQNGVVRIPIEDAMSLLLEKRLGTPAAEAAEREE